MMTDQAIPKFLPNAARIFEGRLIFKTGDLGSALRHGFFALEIPEGFDRRPGVKLSKNFYQEDTRCDDLYKGYREDKAIYFDREGYQTEHLLLDQDARRAKMPADVNQMCEDMYGLGRIVLREILSFCDVPEHLWSVATDGCTASGGVEWFAASHYRAHKHAEGAPAHKDTGFVTVLYYDQPGLEAFIGTQWHDVPPIKDHFLVNFGGALEVLTNDLPICAAAILHRVRQTYLDVKGGDRFSFATFLNPSASSCVYKYNQGSQVLDDIGTVEDFLRDFNSRTWSDSYESFGIKYS